MGSQEALLSKTRLAKADIHEQWERDYLNPDVDAFYDAAFDRIVEALGDTRGKTILDVGCGYCFHTRRLSRSELSVTAVDFSSAALKEAEGTLAGAGLSDRVTLMQADATNLPFADASFDNVLIWGVLMHIPDIEKALSEAARVLKPGGKLALSENNAGSLEVKLVEPLINFAKRALGRKAHERKKVRLGIEEWQPAEQGSLLVRKTDIAALTAYCRTLGLELDKRFAGQFTEIYARVPTLFLKRLIHKFNFAYFRQNRSPGPALGNILVFRKNG